MSTKLLLVAAALIGSGWSAAGPAAAQSLTGNVGSAGVTRGERAIETRVGVNDTGEAAARVHAEYGFTDWFLLRGIVSFNRPDDGDWDYSALTIENWFQWREESRDGQGFNGGLRFAYAFQDGGGPDEAEVRLTLTDRFAQHWEWRANLIGEMETGAGSEGGVALETRAQLSRAVARFDPVETRFGIELFSEYGNTRDLADLTDQAHQLGPVVKVEWGEGYYAQVGARFGLTDASDDAMVKLFVGREF